MGTEQGTIINMKVNCELEDLAIGRFNWVNRDGYLVSGDIYRGEDCPEGPRQPGCPTVQTCDIELCGNLDQ